MADKDDDKDVDKTTPNTKDDKVSAAEEKARGMGWRPKEEYEGDEDSWVDAGEYLRRAPLYEGLHKANRKAKSLEKKLELLYQHQEELVTAKVQARVAELKAEKKQAAKEHDVEKVVAIDEEIEKVQESAKKQTTKISDESDEAQEKFEEWKAENKWYEEDEDMFAYANGIGSKIEKEHPDWTPEKVLNEVAKKTKKAFEWKNKNPNRESASKVGSSKNGPSGSDSPAAKGKLPTYNDLPAEAQALYKEFVKTDKNPHGFMTKEKYLHDYAVKAGLISENE